MKIALITDLHFGARSDSPVFDAFFKKFYEECFFPYLERNDITHVINLGDTFDKRKTINFQTLESCKRYFFDVLGERNITMFTIVGNHDTALKNTNDVNSVDLLLTEYDNIVPISSPKTWTFTDTEVLFMPWICSGNYDESMEALKNATADIVMGHFEIAGFSMYKGSVNEHGFDRSIFNSFDHVFSGHFHHRSTDGNITYLGNPYEIVWSDYDDPRGFHIFDTDSNSLEFIQNPFTIFEKYQYNDLDVDPETVDVSIFSGKYVKMLVVNKTDQQKFDRFVDRLNKQNPVDLKIIEDYSEFSSDTLDDDTIDLEDTVTLMGAYVDSVDTEHNKDKIKNTLKELYVEALNRENV